MILTRLAAISGGYLPNTAAWIAAVAAAGGTVSSTQAGYVNTLEGALSAAGVLSSLDRLWLHAAENATQALIDLVARATATAQSAPTFTANRGYTGNGSTSYLDLGFDPTTAPSPKYVQNSASFGVWEITADAGSSSQIGSAVLNRLISTAPGTARHFEINSSTAANGDQACSTTGLFHAQRTAATTATLYRNGVSFNTSAETSASPVGANFFSLATNNGGTAATQSASQIAASFIGSGLSGNEVAFYNALRAYMTSVGVP